MDLFEVIVETATFPTICRCYACPISEWEIRRRMGVDTERELWFKGVNHVTKRECCGSDALRLINEQARLFEELPKRVQADARDILRMTSLEFYELMIDFDRLQYYPDIHAAEELGKYLIESGIEKIEEEEKYIENGKWNYQKFGEECLRFGYMLAETGAYRLKR